MIYSFRLLRFLCSTEVLLLHRRIVHVAIMAACVFAIRAAISAALVTIATIATIASVFSISSVAVIVAILLL